MLKRGSQNTLGYALRQALKSDFKILADCLGAFFPFTHKFATIVLLSFNFVETSTFPGLLDFYFFINLFLPPLLSAKIVVQQSLFKSRVLPRKLSAIHSKQANKT